MFWGEFRGYHGIASHFSKSSIHVRFASTVQLEEWQVERLEAELEVYQMKNSSLMKQVLQMVQSLILWSTKSSL